MNHIIPDTVRVVASQQTNKDAAQPLLRHHAHIRHNGIGLEPYIPHTEEHGGESCQPHSDHHTLKVNTIANMGAVLGNVRRLVKRSVYCFEKCIPLFPFAALVEVWL